MNDIGYMVETPYSYPNLSVKENLKVYYKLRQLNNPYLIDNIIEKLKLNEYQHKKANVLSLAINNVLISKRHLFINLSY
ncbi:MAG: hypothetical protein R2822_28510 [Spirosomataceae bacterium]